MASIQTPAQKAAATRAANKAAAEEEARKQQRAAAREEAKQIRLQREAEELAAAKHVANVQPAPQHADTDAFDFAALGDLELPSWRRVLIGAVLGIIGAGFTGYGIGMLMAYALAGIATLTTSAVLALVLSIAVWVLGIYASWRIGGYVGGKIFSSVVLPDGLASRSMASVSNAVAGAKNWFVTQPLVEQAKAFSGAHVSAA